MLVGRLLCAALVLAGCARDRAFVLAERIRDVGGMLQSARQSGARRCATSELAMAQAHLDFAQAGLDADDYSGAEDHLLIAEGNAREALRLSPPERCGAGRVPGAPVFPALPARRVTRASSAAQPRTGQSWPLIMREYARR
jgi:hypothetical protein